MRPEIRSEWSSVAAGNVSTALFSHANVSNVGKVAQTRAAIRAFHDWNGVQHRGVAGVTCLGRDAGRERDVLLDTRTGSGRMGYA
jgi:hypothetical protein